MRAPAATRKKTAAPRKRAPAKKRPAAKKRRKNASILDAIRAGDRVTITNRFGQKQTGRAVMRGPHGWVLNLGGAHGTPGIATDANIVKVSPKRNPDTAAKLYEDFHGTPAKRTRTYTESLEHPVNLTDLGRLTQLDVLIDDTDDAYEIEAEGNTRVCSTPAGNQLYFVGGNQSLDKVIDELQLVHETAEPSHPLKDHMVIGEVAVIHYHTKKGFHNFEPVTYFHEFGEEGGERPFLMYDTLNKRIYLTGGSYHVKPEGITN